MLGFQSSVTCFLKKFCETTYSGRRLEYYLNGTQENTDMQI